MKSAPGKRVPKKKSHSQKKKKLRVDSIKSTQKAHKECRRGGAVESERPDMAEDKEKNFNRKYENTVATLPLAGGKKDVSEE